MKNKRMLGNILLLITAMIWGTAFVAQRVGMESIGPATFTSARMWLAALTAGTASLFLSRRNPDAQADPERKRHTVIGGICCGLFLAGASRSASSPPRRAKRVSSRRCTFLLFRF